MFALGSPELRRSVARIEVFIAAGLFAVVMVFASLVSHHLPWLVVVPAVAVFGLLLWLTTSKLLWLVLLGLGVPFGLLFGWAISGLLTSLGVRLIGLVTGVYVLTGASGALVNFFLPGRIEKQTAQSTLLGSARWATAADMLSLGHLLPFGRSKGVCLGLVVMPEKDRKTYDARFWHDGHILTCAPTGSGKGVGSVIPALLDYPGSTIVLDVKGENWAVTHRAREAMGHHVVKVDPFAVMGGGSASYNPLDWFAEFPDDVVPDAQLIAEALVVEAHGEHEAHWEETARDFIKGLMLFVSAKDEGERTLSELRRIVTLSTSELNEQAKLMQTSSHPVIERAGNGFLSLEERERSSLLSTARRHTSFLDDQRVADCLSSSTFKISDLKRSPMDVYLILPPERLTGYARFVRLLISLALTGITRIQGRAEQKVLFLLDEFAQLGRLPIIESSISMMRGYGAMFWLLVQDLSQLKAVYPKWQTFLANTAKQFFGTADFDTAKYISDTIGQMTISFWTEGESSNSGVQSGLRGGRSQSHGTSATQHVQARSLINPDEIMRLGTESVIALIAGEPPHSIVRNNYLRFPPYQGQFDENPLHVEMVPQEKVLPAQEQVKTLPQI